MASILSDMVVIGIEVFCHMTPDSKVFYNRGRGYLKVLKQYILNTEKSYQERLKFI